MQRIFLIIYILLAWTAAMATELNVYFGTSGNETKGIYHATFNTEDGTLSNAKLVAEMGNPGFLALHPDKQKLYAVSELDGENIVAGFHIGQNGALIRFTISPIGDGGGAHIAVHPTGKFLLTAQYGGGSVALFPLDTDGNLGESVISEHGGGSKVVAKRQDSPHPHWCGFSPDGQYAFVPDLGLDGIVIYRVNLEPLQISKHGFAESIPGGGPRHMRFSVDGKFIYLLNELSLSVSTFKFNAETGQATRLSNAPTLSEAVKKGEQFNSAAEILVHPNGRFVYSSNRGNDSITSFHTEPNGTLTKTQVEPIRGSWPRNINMDSSGHWLLAAGAHSNTISVFKIDQKTGLLTHKTNGGINVPGPICILFLE